MEPPSELEKTGWPHLVFHRGPLKRLVLFSIRKFSADRGWKVSYYEWATSVCALTVPCPW
jgi:hypothetical protein